MRERFHCLFLLILLVEEQQGQELTPLNSTCVSSKPCGRNAVCNSDQHCACSFAFEPEPDGYNCRALVACTSSQDCSQHSAHSECDNSSQLCVCRKGYGLIQDRTRCVGELGSRCTQSSHCDAGATCGGRGECVCKIGNQPAKDSKTRCDVYNCNKDSDCFAVFGHYTTCFSGKKPKHWFE